MLRFAPCDYRMPSAAAAQALLQRLAAGNAQALEEVYRQESGAVYRYVLGLCGNPGWAADATQDAFVALAARPEGVDLARGTVGSWLAGVARHSLLAQWRRAARERAWPQVDDIDAVASADPYDIPHGVDSDGGSGDGEGVGLSLAEMAATQSPESLLVRAQGGEQVWAAVRRLPFAQREAVLLVDLQERSYDEASRIAGIELNTLRSRLHRGRARLAQWLEGSR